MPFCPNCGHEHADVKFCAECGAALGEGLSAAALSVAATQPISRRHIKEPKGKEKGKD